MRAVFADTFYYAALLSPKDVSHEAAVLWGSDCRGPRVTTEFVLVELANAYSNPAVREVFRVFLEELQADPDAILVPASTELFREGLELFLDRPDKEWSLTDCISFVVMKKRGLKDALTADHHFDQAGFKALLR
jgi:predicted nucleic acid-binding protein